ncbi:response regulator transcription factor [Pedobacter sp. ISL-68]|jgi:DNA-binding response OmpR family regulator|uniref:response regulator transcription factor n=1 Tax=unclassified Pedobacter TaxID=2628915 RepID=UPI001BE78F18|nr:MULTISPECIES: response regulator transcription factor [unclassified Pedobacter]MBT2560884.1 response regulator transcription factor [Pedobacter sp. ISL-64]MBT2590274.1 response regulator transcription factor [Pedobacter sp. ISL-68]CAH0305858.1 Transcriptional regulatory protein WalR [Pedobacter sp. Bi36]CAH0314196.1 Transcriptional regulatory protein WalR [Pedobacter sp. Bi27]CAH0314782.1 Transcriptional regulatory protein WalR [Pedobacter sp. Bi126]
MSKKLVYVLEDDADISEVVSYILSEEGYEVNGCPTVAAFNHMISQRLPDIAILDIMLPDGNGLDICRQLRMDERTSVINIIMMSANTTKNEIMGSGCGAEFIAKPFNIDHFVARVNQYA